MLEWSNYDDVHNKPAKTFLKGSFQNIFKRELSINPAHAA